jgi:hypothetical protein
VAVIRRFLIHDGNSANGKLMEVSMEKKKETPEKVEPELPWSLMS